MYRRKAMNIRKSGCLEDKKVLDKNELVLYNYILVRGG